MIRASDLAAAASWARPATASQRADAQDPSTWFDGAAAGLDVRISGDLSLASRGLSVEQHAARVLMQLCGEPDASAEMTPRSAFGAAPSRGRRQRTGKAGSAAAAWLQRFMRRGCRFGAMGN